MRMSVVELSQTWKAAGGGNAGVVNAVAVSLAESGGRTDAISPSADYGLWQINRIHFGTLGIDSSNWSDPMVNARVAVALSGNGSNWAAWCTCWSDPGPNCGHGFIAAPQNPSPAYSQLPGVMAVLGYTGGATSAAPPPDPLTDIHSAWGQVQDFVGYFARSKTSQLASLTKYIGRIR